MIPLHFSLTLLFMILFSAFSWFSLCEYVIATCNMLYHVSVALDFSDEHLIVRTHPHQYHDTVNINQFLIHFFILTSAFLLPRPPPVIPWSPARAVVTVLWLENGRLDDQPMVGKSVSPGGPHPSPLSLGSAAAHQVMSGGKVIGVDKSETGKGVASTGGGGGGSHSSGFGNK